jgi:hypothetical protein
VETCCVNSLWNRFFLLQVCPSSSLAFFHHRSLLSVMELGPPIPDIPLWEPAAAATPVTAVSTSVVSQVAQSVVEVSLSGFLPVSSLVRCTRNVMSNDNLDLIMTGNFLLFRSACLHCLGVRPDRGHWLACRALCPPVRPARPLCPAGWPAVVSPLAQWMDQAYWIC